MLVLFPCLASAALRYKLLLFDFEFRINVLPLRHNYFK
jgi:hypothetical protein